MHTTKLMKSITPQLFPAIKIGAVLLPAGALVASYFAERRMDELQWAIHTSLGLHLLFGVGLCIMVATIFFYIWLTSGALRYRPVPGAEDGQLPTLTVVVPAYNEGELVLDTLRSLVDSDYPPDKLQIIAVDDGSRDNTWDYIQEAVNEHPDRITALRQPRNSGKRQALYQGFKRATGDILITVDSDSIVAPDTLRNMASPFIDDDDCGAVAGNVRVWNREHQIIPKMLDVGFVFSFEFIRSAQSYFRTVICTPGALSAYRRQLVMTVLDEWLNQKFFGREARIGEDRALTNLILRQGKSVLFQSNAVVYTNVPVVYGNLCKMLIRWGRSNVRENLKMARYVFTDFRGNNKTSARILLVMQCLRCFPAPIWLALMIWMVLSFPLQALLSSLGGIAIWSTISAFIYARRYSFSESLWAYAYSIFYMASLSWITSYSLFTMHRSGWLTRTLDPQTASKGRKVDDRLLTAPALESAIRVVNIR